tara:strand:- start:648 stop:1358 length:711 start_codon:yes stop_codon:yes gene_type:complete
MGKLDKRILRELIKEELELYSSRNTSSDEVERLDEFVSTLAGLATRGAGLGASEFTSPESEDLFGGMSSGIRTALEQSALEAVVKAVGLEPDVGFGLILKNTLERVIRKYSTDDLQSMVTDPASCDAISYEIALETLTILEESFKERALKLAIDSIGGELGEDIQKSPLFKPIYQNMREKFSEAFDDILDEEQLARELSNFMCDQINIDSIIDSGKSFAGDAYDAMIGEFSNIFSE